MKQYLKTNIHWNSVQKRKDNDVQLPYNIDLLSILNDAVIITDENFRICYWNPAAEEIYGWNPSEVMGKTAKKVLRTKLIDKDRSKTYKTLRETGSYENDFLQFTKKNFPLYISSKTVTITDASGVIKGHISINRDMTSDKNAAKKLKRSYNILNSIVENTTDAIYLKNLSGNYIMANSTASKIIGKPISEIIGKNDWELYPKKDAEIITREDKQIIENEETRTYEESLYSQREGEVRNYSTTKGPYMGFGDSILGIFGICRDITHLNLVEDRNIHIEQKYRSLFDTMKQGVVFHDPSGKIVSMNYSAENILGYTFEEIKGKTSQDIFSNTIHEDGTEFLNCEFPSKVAFETGLEVEDVVMGLKIPQGYRWLNIHAVPLFHEGENVPYQVYTIFNDVTCRIKTENELKDTLNQLQLSNSELEQFAYIASNDLKEPLRIITSFLQLIQRRYNDKLDDDANDFIEFAVNSSIRLHELINALLEYSMVNTMGNEITNVDIAEVLMIVENNLEILISENDANINCDGLPTIWADKTQMIQLFQCLIINSIKYRGIESPKIHISAVNNNDKWIFSVEDNGIGIPPESSEEIFKIFHKLNVAQEYNGAGIGLAISKRIVEKHGGTIWIDTERINGTKIIFSLRSD